MKIALFLALSLALHCAFSQEDSSHRSWKIPGLSLDVFGFMTYNAYDWQSDPEHANAFDLNSIEIEPEYHFAGKAACEAEIEFEHGGTGSTMEFDKQEEFGEFEQEVEKGGEVEIEEFELNYTFHPWLQVKAGKIRVPFGSITDGYKPLDFFTTTYNNVEQTLIPAIWYAFGVGAEGKLGPWEYDAVFVNALDNSLFSSANWIRAGNEERFETVNANAFAAAGRIDYALTKDSKIGISGYIGNSTPNRPKPDIDVPAYVGLADMHIHIQNHIFRLNGMAMFGSLQNADLISNANANLPNDLQVKRSPVGSTAFGAFGEAAWNVLSLNTKTKDRLDVFAGYYYYDSMLGTTGDVFNNPRWERREVRTGINYVWNDHITLKSDVTICHNGLAENNRDITYTTALGFQF